ncbi:MAG: hypothetical protein A3I88_01625 [Candidatus Portnoybacteria bacterium RIFCSPLOWO2_12_FULL_39_9]|uniref:Uncharacterized protein n=1 Tax=Candidatus Portnoybacteria bacterium RIFCSPHIGHO2_12_FULL_38_9 TaxID=1801997 RepID=A0A1G2FHU8_9BACT|nr:MAG: hypothetical protein A3H00_03010 [Candidatus Portnoybacteria bacterium RBG_13_40_8]OGZ36423.1 MAG: hypothetical protein A2646_03205 [Candidatus Portnoybacteria bacterium RIFCSPHIGHO2_02_FULL_39_12]OGZ37362.1 MAG: hypothetical protein A3J64_00160 [Candidatus Portnoybacteria bacterium RIFCSPHIGHO2_12_FULL_38_9]OGZ39322.1 MAG: hypothetical protein A3F21_02130 [Candidatus Portnoybacteria bacterium RIFCSPLOWO2_01_FULL_38_39]OGZ40993.1 MAG: hypothetical protein A3I88_01625 [Candidatus Portnoy
MGVMDRKRNTWSAKFVRFFTAFLPVAENRAGKCIRCGRCCQFFFRCPFLRYDREEKSYCVIYPIRLPACRVYPRNKKEWLTQDTCGFRFE